MPCFCGLKKGFFIQLYQISSYNDIRFQNYTNNLCKNSQQTVEAFSLKCYHKMLKMEKKKTIEQKEQSWWKRTPSLPCLMGNRKNTIFLVSCSILETGGYYSHFKMLSETSKAQKTSIKKSKTCSRREWQNLSIFKKCIKNHSSSSENCYSTGRGCKVHTYSLASCKLW